MAVSGGVAAFAPRGRLPHISEAFRTGWNRTDRLSSWIERVGRMIKRARQVVSGPLARNVFDSIESPHSNSFHN